MAALHARGDLQVGEAMTHASVPAAYAIAKVTNACVMSLAAIPTYFLARRLLSPSSRAFEIAIAACAAYSRNIRWVSFPQCRGRPEYSVIVPTSSPCAMSGRAMAEATMPWSRGFDAGTKPTNDETYLDVE